MTDPAAATTDRPEGAARAAVHVVVNPASGGAVSEAEIRRALGPEVVVHETTADDPGTAQTRSAVEQGADRVVACGGDGTVRACAESVVGTSAVLGVVPLGTGNLLASNLGLETGLDAAEAALDGTVRVIDTGLANGRTFTVMAGSGFDALMVRDAGDTLKRRFGSLAYVWSGAKNAVAQLVPTRVELDGEVFYEGRTNMVLVGNMGTVTGGLDVFPDAEPDDGLLDVAVLSVNSIGAWLSVMWRLLRDKAQRSDLVVRSQARQVTVTTSRPRPFELDGEAQEPVERVDFEVRPCSLRVSVARA